MNLKKYSSFITIFIAALIGLIIHKVITHFIIPTAFEDNFIYSTPLLYVLFAILSMAIVFALAKVKEVALNYVGYAFLAFTTLKMVIAYALLRPIIHIHLAKTPTEKMNFFFIFIYFLAIETYLTIRILNNKQ
ncbi:hypothetical protein QWY90_13915 [Flavobacterium paronense]|uniref:ATP synthase protein I n=1 Tax=Flavobacterium paronense TaxID=1392775 RepID=A0ABV5GEP7_9FLAO|nr:hypothetical protein [Flavobacterium paronense]MDN3678406.1 hypothetical protein [Flavobacterium paronense]